MRTALPEGRLARAGVAGATALKIGAGELRHRAKRPFMSQQKRENEQSLLDDKNARLLFEALTQLRGTALKLAQMLGMELDLLPEHYRRELEKSFHQVPPLNRVLVRKVIMQEFAKTPEQLFCGFDDVAFAAASLGQVHAAILPDNTEVAVKIQYPGIHVALDSDMNLLRKVALALPNSKIVRQSIDEVHARLREEVDYRLEAKTTRWFHDNLKLDGIIVPKVYEDWCSDRVLTTEYCAGMHMDNWLATEPSQAMRDQAGQYLYDLFIHSVRTLRRLHADPNPGNYLFRDDGSVALIDFGCVKQLSEKFVDVLPNLLTAYNNDEPKALLAAYKTLGMAYDNDAVYEAVLRPFGRWLTEPFAEEYFDFAEHADYTRRGQELIQNIASMSGVDNLADDFIFFDRTIYGLCKIFERLGARIRMKHHWEIA